MNKDYKRWTTRNEKGEWMIELNEELKMVQHNLPKDEFIKVLFNITALRLAELEDKIENGTLVELPCKVGDTVYEICKDCSNCSHFKETGWEYDCWCDFDDEEHKTMFEVDGDNDCIYRIDEIKFEYNSIAKFGKSVFLTKPEAEARLKELKGERE